MRASAAGGDIFPYQMALAEMDLFEGKLAVGKQLLRKPDQRCRFTRTRNRCKNRPSPDVFEQKKFRSSREVSE